MTPPDMGGDTPMGGGMPDSMPPQGGPQDGMGGPGGEDMPAEAPEGFSPQMNDGNDGGLGATPETDPNAEVETEEEEEEVIDVDDLTKSQESTEHKIDMLSNKFEKVLSIIDKFEQHIEDNGRKMEELRVELEKRNPTPVEKMTMRSTKSGPYTTTPEEYWENEKPENYSPESDENGENMPEYKITKADIDNVNDWKSISDSFKDYGFMNVRDLLR